jgi:hypothetical protein
VDTVLELDVVLLLLEIGEDAEETGREDEEGEVDDDDAGVVLEEEEVIVVGARLI